MTDGEGECGSRLDGERKSDRFDRSVESFPVVRAGRHASGGSFGALQCFELLVRDRHVLDPLRHQDRCGELAIEYSPVLEREFQ